jgi:acetyltransferase
MSIRNFDALFDPKAIALIGASNQPGSVGAVLARNLFSGGFGGPVLAVNPHEAEIAGAISYKSVAQLPLVPDLAVIATPAATVPPVVAELASKGCRAAIVISAGMGGKASGLNLQQAMLDAARPALMRIVGPNCLGIITPGKRINASFAHLTPREGSLALVSQSGAIATALLDWADGQGIGFSHVVSVGDMSDVDFGDLLDFLSADRRTGSILMYVENITHAKKFMSAARIAARAKPVVVVKAGRSVAGAKAALSHTGALAGSDLVYEAAFRRAGLLRVQGLEELFEAAATLATGMRVRGDRLTILTNGGGGGVLAADALESEGGRLASLGDGQRAALDAALPAAWSHGNPVDILGDADAARYASALEILATGEDSDGMLVINCPTAVADGLKAATVVADAVSRRPFFPVVTNWLGGAGAAPARSLFGSRKIPSFESPEDAVRAFMHLVRYRRNQELLLETPSAGIMIDAANVLAARQLIAAALNEGRSVLMETESKALLALFGIPTAKTFVAETPERAAHRFREVGAPCALKILSPDITHKSDVGGVRLHLAFEAEVESAAQEMLALVRPNRPEARLLGFTVQEMIVRPNALELIAGIANDATFGPVLLFGHGGKATEVLEDRVIGLPPLNSVLARDMIERPKVAKLFGGFRDVPPVAREALVDTMLRLSELSVHLPEVGELDINPLLADATGVIAIDARVVLRKVDSGFAGPAIRPYPRELEQEVTLLNGRRFLLRPIRPEDELALISMLQQCTHEDLRLRFFGPLKAFPHEMAARLSQIDYDREMALVATECGATYGTGPLFGVVRLVADPENEAAEFAVLVRSDLKGAGLGYRLMIEILAHARKRRLKRVYGDVLRENATMLRIARELGFQIEPFERGSDAVRVTSDIAAFPAK